MRIHQDNVQLGEHRAVDAAQAEMAKLRQSYDSLKAQLLADVKRERQAILALAQEEAARIREAAAEEAAQQQAQVMTECDAIQESARQAGYEAGYQQGRQDGLRDVMQSAEAVVENLRQAEARLFYSLRRDLAQMVEAVCQRVLQQRLQAKPDDWQALIDDAIKQCVEAKSVTVVLPEALVHELQALHPDSDRLRLIPDRQLQAGQAFVITDKTSVNFSLDTQIQTLLAALSPETWLPENSALQPPLDSHDALPMPDP